MWTYFLILISIYLTIGLSAVLINKFSINKGLKGIPVYQCFSPVKWMSVLYGFILKTIVPLHIFEQYVLRIYDKDCSVCVKNGKCIGGLNCGFNCACGCDTLAKMYSPFETDSGHNWDKIIFNKKKYEEFRKKYPITINISYDKQSV